MYEFIGRPKFNAIEKAKLHGENTHLIDTLTIHTCVIHSPFRVYLERERVLFMLILWIISKLLYAQRWTRCELLDHKTEIYYALLRNKHSIQFKHIDRVYYMTPLLAYTYHEYWTP